MNINARVDKLRELMKERNITHYIIPTSDPHQSEYVIDHYKVRTFISGFTGSAGVAIVTMDKALLWADGRYYVQAAKEIDGSEFKLMKWGMFDVPNWEDWIIGDVKKGDIVGLDEKIASKAFLNSIYDGVISKEATFDTKDDLISMIWQSNRPELPKGKTFFLEKKYSGLDAKEKIEQVREIMEEKGVDYLFMGALDDVNWTYNIRGFDSKCSPIVVSYGLIGKNFANLYIDESKLNDDVIKYLKENDVTIKPYEEIAEYLKNLKSNEVILMEAANTNLWIWNSVPKDVRIKDEMTITTMLKAMKNPVEIENTKYYHVFDGLALTKFLHWLDKNVATGTITETEAEDKLHEFRLEQPDFLMESFDTISAYGPNGAMMHYRSSREETNVIKPEGFYLVDSGGQYLGSTTDITRTVKVGDITDKMKKDFTLVVKSHAALAVTKFLYGTTGQVLDMVARYPMWQNYQDYKSGTGHGVGHCLHVHEGPHRIATKPNSIALEEGMVISDEPGVYREGEYGIRIENLIVTKKDRLNEQGQFMCFETYSFAPIDIRCIIPEMLNAEEKEWLNNYHVDVYNKLSPYMNEEEKLWLDEMTRRI